MSETARLVSLDLGNGFCKYVASAERGFKSATKGYFPSVYALEEPGIDFDGLSSSKDLVIELPDGNRYAVGWSAWRLGNIPIRTLDRTRVQGPEYRILFAAALASACGQSGTIAPVLSLPVLWYDRREEVRQSLSGLWEVKVGGRWLSFNIPIDNIRLIPEGFGSICSMALSNSGKVVANGLLTMRVGVLDVGTKTTDLLMFDALEFVPARTGGAEVGLSQIYNIMGRLANKQGFRAFSDEELDGVLHGDALYDGPDDISEQANDWKHQALQQVANSIAAEIKTLWQGGREVQKLLLTGGGAQHTYPYLLDHFPDHLQPVADGPMANVLGGWSYGMLKGQ